MRDAWEISNGLVVGTHDAMEDPDGDGIVNVLEHDAGGDPQDHAAIGGLLSWSRWDWPGTPADPEKFIAAGGPSRDPVHRDALAGFKLPRGTGTGTIDRLYGTLTAPEDGIYSFWLTGKVPAILSLSTDSHAFNKRTIARNAHLRSATNIVWQGNTHSVRSIPVRLKKGEKYFIEALLPSITTYPPFGVSWTRHAPDSWSDGGLAEGVSGTWSEQEGSTVARVAGIGGFGGTSGDTMAFRHVEVEGAAEAIGRMDSLTTLPKGSGGGLMLRESSDPFAPFVAVTFDARRKIVFHSRVKPGEPVKCVESTRSLAGTLRLKESLWLRLRADGKECHALWSVDGVTWHEAGKIALKFGERTMAGPVAWGAASKEPVEVKFSDLVVDGLFGSEPVPAKVLATAGPDPEDTDSDGLPDAWERQHGIDTAIGKGPDGAGGDPDGDRLSHAREFKLGGDPRKVGGIPGYLSRERWDGIPGSRVSDLVDHLKFRGKPDISDLIPRPDLEGGIDSNYGQRIRGTIVAPADGTYRFWIAGDNGCSLALSKSEDPLDNRVIASLAGVDGASAKMHEWEKFPSQVSAPVELVGGREYFIEILHKEGRNSDHIAVAWEYRTQAGQLHAREILPSAVLRSYVPDTRDRDEDELPDEWEVRMGLNPQDNGYHDTAREGSAGDHDGDRLTNREEYLLGTHPCMADSDGDGVGDFDEVRLYGTDPLRKDLTPPKKLADLRLENHKATSGDWVQWPDGALGSVSRRGSLDFTFTVAKAGIHLIELEALAHSYSTYVPPIPVTACVDRLELGGGEVTAAGSRLRWLTGWLSPGEHTLSIENRNVRTGVSLKISSLSVYYHEGEDQNWNGNPDWIDAFIRRNAGVKDGPEESKVSPAFIEGSSRLPGSTSVVAESGTIDVQQGLANRWFANIPLDASRETKIAVSFENGAMREERVMRWAATNLFDSPEKIRVRLGDSLKLTAVPTGTPQEATVATVTMNGELLGTATAAEPRIVTFDKPGIATLTATASADGQPVEASVEVEVVTADFGPQLAISAGTPRAWDLPGVPHDLVLEADAPLTLVESDRLPPDSRRLVASYPRRMSGTPRVLARLGANGPALAATTVTAFHVVPASATGNHRVIEVLPDGTRVVEVRYVFNGVIPENLSVWLQLYVTDAVFANGDTWYQLTARDFDENGEARLLIYKAPGHGVAYVCHWFRPFHDDPADAGTADSPDGDAAPDAAGPEAAPTAP